MFEAYALDHGDIDGVFGPDHTLEAPQHGVSHTMTVLHDWIWQRVRGYPSIHARRDALRERLEERSDGVVE